MRLLRKIVARTAWSVALMCIGISFIVMCVFHNDPHTAHPVMAIGAAGAVVLAIFGLVAYPDRLPVPGGH